MKVGIVVLCRLNSKRLYKKAILDLDGVPAIERCLMNCKQSQRSDCIVLATSTTEEDSELESYAINQSVDFFKGSPDNPAKRILQVANKYGLDCIVRVTGDSPLVSYELIDDLIEFHLEKENDYSYLDGAPLGTKSEVFMVDSIKKIMDLTDTRMYSEYLTLYFMNNPHIFKIDKFCVNKTIHKYANVRLGLDYPEDYKMLSELFSKLDAGNNHIELKNILSVLDKHKELININGFIVPKYKKEGLKEELQRATTL